MSCGSCGASRRGGAPNSRRSAPALKWRPFAASTMALMSGRARVLSKSAVSSVRTAADKALTGGLSSTKIATLPDCSNSTAIRFALSWAQTTPCWCSTPIAARS